MPDEGEEGNAAYSGKLGKRGQVRKLCGKLFNSFHATGIPINRLHNSYESHSQLSPRVLFFQFIHFPHIVRACTIDGDTLPRSEIGLQKIISSAKNVYF